LDTWSYIGIAMVLYVAYTFVKRLGKTVPVLELMLLIAGAQWIIGPLIEYASPGLHWKYYMYVEQPTYMAFVVPAYTVFTVAVLAVIKKTAHIDLKIDALKDYSNYGVIIFVIGMVFDVFGSFLPGPLGFFGFILSNFKYIGAIILFYSENKTLKKLFYFTIAYLLLTSILRGLFHDFLLWSTFFFMFWALKHKPSVPSILGIFLAGALFATTLQTVKAAYRLAVAGNFSGNKIELFGALMVGAFLADETSTAQLDDGTDNNVRLNQGWIISAVMDQIPRNETYLNGESIADAVLASIFPRFLNPNKAKAGGQENFRRFTGLQISAGTSMGISILGEAYGNFAIFGGIVFMGVWGFFLGRIWLFLFKKIKGNRIFIAFIPLIFLQVIKAETELVVVLNHLIKSMLVVLLFMWFAKHYLKWNFEND
jgi:hypothetical protein